MDFLDARAFAAPGEVPCLVETALAEGRNSYSIFQELGGDIDRLWPELPLLGRRIVDSVDSLGYALIDGLGIANFAPMVRDVMLLSILNHVGRFTVHDSQSRVLWDVKDFSAADMGRKLTFSEQLGECPLHSDSAFAHEPEKYLCLYVQKEAADGGESVVISMKQAIEELLDEDDGRRCAVVLLRNVFPFCTPPAFSNRPQLITAPILNHDPEVRFRYDCLIEGFAAVPDLDTPERRWAVEYFSEFVESRASRHKFLGTRDQLIVIDNRRTLHARTDYQDKDRHLVRARLRPLEGTAPLHVQC